MKRILSWIKGLFPTKSYYQEFYPHLTKRVEACGMEAVPFHTEEWQHWLNEERAKVGLGPIGPDTEIIPSLTEYELAAAALQQGVSDE